MLPTKNGAMRLFRFAGISVYVHYSWFLVLAYAINNGRQNYSSFAWNIAEYPIALFAIVLMHEFGHALACRQVGGQADQIVLWPLGGVAYVAPPPRPGAQLWSIAAGPLVNVALLPVTFGIVFFYSGSEWETVLKIVWFGSRSGVENTIPDFLRFVCGIARINLGLLIFNILPIYPLDGGQILQSLLWFVLGRARSLTVASAIGFAGGLGFIALAFWLQSFWLGIMAAFLLSRCVIGFKQAKLIGAMLNEPRHAGFA